MNNDLFYTKTSGMFVTSIIGNYNIATGEIVWVNAGHQPALVRDKNGNFEEYESKSPPLGVIVQKAKSSYSINRINLNSNRLYAFTDGLSESLDENNEEIGIEGSKKVINNNFSNNINDELDNITKEITTSSKIEKLSDELTIVVIGK